MGILMIAAKCKTFKFASRTAYSKRSACQTKATPQKHIMVNANNSGTSIELNQILKDLSDRWDKVEDKTSVLLYGGGSLVLLWLATTIVSSIGNIPLLPKLMELVGLSYSAWFTYRYLIFKSSRQELVKDIEALKEKISGDQQ